MQVSEQQRNGVRDRLLKEGSFQKTKLNVHVSVGTRLPRSVRLLPLSVAIIELAPTYRGYDYVVLEDETICIVDPSSYEIVDVLPVGMQRAERPERPTLALSQEQLRFIAGNVPREPQARRHGGALSARCGGPWTCLGGNTTDDQRDATQPWPRTPRDLRRHANQ